MANKYRSWCLLANTNLKQWLVDIFHFLVYAVFLLPFHFFFGGGCFFCFSCIFYFLKPFCFVLRNSWLTALWSFYPLFDRKHLCPRFQLCGSGRADDTYNRHLLLLLVHHSAPLPCCFSFTNPSPPLWVLLILLLELTSPSIFVSGWYLTQS